MLPNSVFSPSHPAVRRGGHRVQALLPAAMLMAFTATALAAPLSAQSSSAMLDPLGLPMTRIGSGTAWLPDSAPMFGVMRDRGSWMFMLHGSAFAQQVSQRGPRGDSQFGVVNWGMINALRPVSGGRLQLRAMASVDAFTVGGRGYPLLLQTGESYRGEALHDRQHPHDLLMEIAAVYERRVARDVAVQLYVAPAGEPALGPVAFPHRPSAAGDPLATLSHHWQDATHVSFGVATMGVYTRRLKLEGSVFNGREPDDVRTNIDWKGASLDSYAGRLTVNPTSQLSLSTSMGWLADAEKAHPGETVRRAVVSALWSRTRGPAGSQSLALILGGNSLSGAAWTRSAGLEVLHDRGGLQLFARAEVVEKSAEELVLDEDHDVHTSSAVARAPGEDDLHRVGHVTVGAVAERPIPRFGRFGLGMRGTVNVVPAALESIYGSRRPLGMAVFIRWRTSRMNIGMDHSGMHHDEMALAGPVRD